MAAAEGFFVDFPTLGDLLDAWIAHHCRVPDGFSRGAEFRQSDWQFWCTANHYRIRPDALWIPEQPLMNQAFVYRRSQIVAPQKTGKGPWAAAVTTGEAVGPSVFNGWAEAGELYECADNGCSCGWTYEYLEGEPKGIRHPSPLIQLTATSEDQVDNILRPLKAMIRLGPLSDMLLIREDFIRIVGESGDEDMDRIDAVTSNAQSKLGNPISFAFQDESGLYTKTNKMVKVAETRAAAPLVWEGGRLRLRTLGILPRIRRRNARSSPCLLMCSSSSGSLLLSFPMETSVTGPGSTGSFMRVRLGSIWTLLRVKLRS